MPMSAVGSELAPTLVASRTALPPEGAAAPAARQSRFRGPGWHETSVALSVIPTLPASRGSLPPEGAGLAWGGPALWPMAPMLCALPVTYTLFKRRPALTHFGRIGGFTLIELLVVVAIMAIATAGVGLSLRDSSATALERDAQRLAVLLESARAQSRMTGNPVRWRPTAGGFSFEGLTGPAFPSHWLSYDVRVAGIGVVVLGPEPVIGPQQIRLVSSSEPTRSLTLATDGVRPFSVLTAASSAPP